MVMAALTFLGVSLASLPVISRCRCCCSTATTAATSSSARSSYSSSSRSLLFNLSSCAPRESVLPQPSTYSSTLRSSKRIISRRRLQLRASAGETKKKVLVVNTPSGGHAFVGFWVAKELQAAGYQVTLFTAGDENSDKMKKPPFSRFSELREIGVETVWGDASAIGDKLGSSASFDTVLENNGKDLEAVKPVADWAKKCGVGQFLFVSSAGIYKTTDEPPHVEGDDVKAGAGHAAVEDYIDQLIFGSWASFRPQYMTGSGNNKDCEEWFFDRIVRNRPIPIPSPGLQLTNIAHVSDVSSMITLTIEKPKEAHATVFNAVSDRAVTFDGLVRFCGLAAGREAKIVHYDPKVLDVDAKKAFPFRNMHFYAEPRAAKEKLGWKSKTNLSEDLKARFQEYVDSGRHRKEIKFELDDRILDTMKIRVTM